MSREHSHGPAQPPLLHAAEEGDAVEVETLLLDGHEVDGRDQLGWTALHEAALSNSNTAVCSILLRHGAHVAAPNHYGETPLHMAAANESAAATDICRLLISHGASVDAADEQSKLPLDIAEERGGLRPREQQDALRTLLQRVVAPRPSVREGLSIEAIVAMLALVALIAWLNGWSHSTTLAFMTPLPAVRMARVRLVQLG